jgi:branched-chain amino acid transport system substrate-binding protein
VAAVAAVSVCVVALAGCGSRESHAALENALRAGSIANNSQATAPESQSVPPGDSASDPSTTTGSVTNTNPALGATSAASSSATGGSAGQSGTSTTTKTATGPTSGGGSSGGSGPSSTSALVPGVQACPSEKAPVVIGSVGEQSGLAGAAVAGGAQTVAAWAAYVNSLGGLRCHPIRFISADDGADPSRNAAQTQQLVEEDHVVAFVYNDAPLAAAGSTSYLVQHDIPVIGNEGGEESMYQHPNFFPQANGGDALVYGTFAGLAPQLTANQRRHFGVLSCIEAAECSVVGKQAPTDAPQVGLKLIYNTAASLTAPSFTAQCLKAKQAGVQALLIVLDPNSVHRAAADCRQSGFTGVFATGSIIVTADFGTDPNLQGLIFAGQTEPWMITSNKQIALMNQALGKYAPGVSNVGSPALGWTAAQLFAKSSTYWPDSNTITSADVLAGMDRIKDYDVGGLTGPMTFTARRNAPSVTCWYEVAVRKDTFYSPNNGARACK